MADEDDIQEEDALDEETEGLEEGEGSEGGAKVSGKKKLIIIVAAAAVLVVLIGAGLFFSGIIGGGPAQPKPAEKKETSGPIFYDLPPFTVNLNTDGKRASFLKLKITLELHKESDALLIEKHLPRITDSFNTYLRELRASDLSGSAGMFRLKEELMLRLGKVSEGAAVRDVLFKEVMIQ